MKSTLLGALALSLALSQFAAVSASAEQAGQAAHFRTAQAQSFSSTDLQRYGLNQAQTNRAMDLQRQGYQIKVLTPEEAQRYQAGVTDNQWLLIGILAAVIVIAVAVSD